jgi:L-asparaginase / beta-aspartyl-peptidase
VDYAGNVSLPFNCSGMYRGVVRQDNRILTAIYDEPLVEFAGSRPDR